MSGSHFDLDKIRRNWDLVATTEPNATPRKLADVQAPIDPFVAAKADFSRLCEVIGAEVPAQMDTLKPFLDRVNQAIVAMEKATLPTPRADDAPPAPEVDLGPLRDELDDALFDLEDLLEVFTMVPP